MRQATPALTIRDRARGILRLLGWLGAAILRDLGTEQTARDNRFTGLMLWAGGFVVLSTAPLGPLHWLGAAGMAWWLSWALWLSVTRRRR